MENQPKFGERISRGPILLKGLMAISFFAAAIVAYKSFRDIGDGRFGLADPEFHADVFIVAVLLGFGLLMRKLLRRGQVARRDYPTFPVPPPKKFRDPPKR